jgi:hypothetical protein
VTAAAALPQPLAVVGVVFHDFAARTLSVRPSDRTAGYEKLLWQQAWQRQRRAQEAGWPVGSTALFADLPSAPGAAHGLPAEGGVMSFHFPPGTAGYSELISKPGPLVAFVTVDRGSHEFLTCRFSSRAGVGQ